MVYDDRGVLLLLIEGGTDAWQQQYELSPIEQMTIGRDIACQIRLDSNEYGMVSRTHAAIRPLPVTAGATGWQLCDLGSANGTYLNGQRLDKQSCQTLRSGDRIMLGENGARFRFEQTTKNPTAIHPTAYASPESDTPNVTLTKLFPILSTGGDLTHKAYLLPGALTVGFVVLMFMTIGNPIAFNRVVGIYIAGLAYYFIYQLCGKRKPWWVLLAACLGCILILRSPILTAFIAIFRGTRFGQLPQPGETLTGVELLIRMFVGTGLMEELLKALPVLTLFFLGRIVSGDWRDRVGVWEPLDGILLGTASAVGFTLLETLGQYVPAVAQESGTEAGLQVLIPRILGSVAGHMAYSGYLGYFIGLSVLIPQRGWQILAVGYLTASGLHALWNTFGSINVGFLMSVGVISYAFLMAAILKARELSPTRAQNFATHLFDPRSRPRS
jgi:RsiW-degrading membrane proteinase PrsW (M82 family)